MSFEIEKPGPLGIIANKSETAELTRAFGARAPWGPVDTWPRTLVGYVDMILAMPTPAIIFWGPEQTQLYNDGYATIMGPRHPRYFGAPYRECWPDTHPVIYPWMRRVLDHGEVVKVERQLFVLTRHGFAEEAYFTFSFSPLRDDDGAIAGILQPVIEVTDVVLAERRAEMLRALASIADTDDVLDRAVAALAQNDKDVPFSLVYLRDDGGGLRLARRSRNLDDGEAALGPIASAARRALETGATVEIDDVALVSDGHSLGPWPEPAHRAVALPLRRAESEGPHGVVVFGLSSRLPMNERYRTFLAQAAAQLTAALERHRLVEAERLARREAELQRAHLSALFTQAPTPMMILRGPDHVVELANRHSCAMWGRSEGELVDRPLLQALPELAGQPFYELLDEVLRTGETRVGKEAHARVDRRGDGRLEDGSFNFVYAPLRGPRDEIEGVLMLAFDVTDEVRAREKMDELLGAAESESRAKDEFLAMLGHELRNPLAALQTSLYVMRRRLPTTVEPQLDVVERQASHLARIVDDLLDVSRITRGKIELRRQPLDLAKAVAHALESARPLFTARDHELCVSLPEEPVWIDADPVRVEQVTFNLLANAAKYTHTGGRVEVTVSRSGDVVALRVRDNGVGIADDLRPRLFQLFQQGARDLSRSQGGLGIGLTIVRSLVELHGGRVEAISGGVGKGTEMIVRLPVIDGPAAPRERASPLAAKRVEPGVKVMVVDDNVDAAQALADLLATLGCETRVAFDGPAAVTACGSWPPHVVFLDIGLPAMNGYQVAKRLREVHGYALKLVALTGYGQDDDRRRCLDAGFDQHLVKPARLDALLEILTSLEVRRVTTSAAE